MGRIGRVLALLWGVLGAPAPAMADTVVPCGQPQGICAVAGGVYRLVLPEGPAPDGGYPALLYLHGWGANSAGALGRFDQGRALTERGFALIAPEGVPRAGRTQKDWAVEDGRPHSRDDGAFLTAVLSDAAARGVDRGRVLLSGFSRGGSYVWNLACRSPGMVRAYAPFSGAFWEPMPERCAGPVALWHSHGWTDRVVPLEGRSFRQGTVVQGDVFQSLFVMRATLGCAARQPERGTAEGVLWVRHWTDCAAGELHFELHPGGHAAPPGWLGRMLDWFESLEARPRG